MWVPESCTPPPFSSLKWPLFKRQFWAEKICINRSQKLSIWSWALDHKIVALQSLAGEKLNHKEVAWLDQGHGGTLGLMEFSPVPVTIIRVNGGPEHENAWQRTGSFYLPVPSPSTCQLSYRSPGRGPPSAVAAGLPATHGSTIQQSIACPDLEFVPVALWGMEGSTALGRSPVAQHAKQAGPVPKPRVKHRSARLWLCVLVCDHGHFQKLERPNQGKRNIHLFCSASIHLLIFLFIHLIILYWNKASTVSLFSRRDYMDRDRNQLQNNMASAMIAKYCAAQGREAFHFPALQVLEGEEIV